MKKTGYLGELEQMVLLAILHLGDGAYGTPVKEVLDQRADRSVSRGALYVTLDRLEQKGMIRSTAGESTPGRGGRPKRYLRVTSEGLTAVRGARRTWERLWDGLDAVFE
jgi:PadR family transcriptional regulator PadR